MLTSQGFLPKSLGGRLALAALGVGLIDRALAQPAIRTSKKISLSVQAVPLSTTNPLADRVGSLRFLGGLAVRSTDPGFGGLSGLIAEDEGAFVRVFAATDKGHKFSGRLVLVDGRLRGLDTGALEPLLNEEGRPVEGKKAGDAESLSRLGDGRVLVGFERKHRIWVYGPGLTGRAQVFETPAALKKAPSNGGLESIASWPDGRVLAIAERLNAGGGARAAFLFRGAAWTPLGWKGSDPDFNPSDAATLPNGDLLVLERFRSSRAPTQLGARIVLVKGEAVKPGGTLQGEVVAELKAPLSVENFEGIAVFRNARGSVQVLLVSDDDFDSAQRTLLLLFEMDDR